MKYLKLGLWIALPSFFILYGAWFARISVQAEGLNCYLSQDQFALSWIHSVEQERWRESYQRQAQALLLTTSEFKTYGAGVPNTGQLVSANAKNRSATVIYQVDRLLPELNWLASSQVRLRLEANQQAWDLYSQLPDYTAINVQVRRYSLWQLLNGEACDDYFTTLSD